MRFDPLSEKDIKEALVNHDNVPEKDAALAARLADGSFLRARQYIDPGTMERKEKAVNFLRTVLYKSRKEINELIVQLDNDNDRRDFSEMFMFLQQWFRDAMQMREGAAGNRDIPDRESIDRFNNSYPSWQYTNAIETLERSISLLDKNVYIPLILINVAHNLRRAVGARKTN
jgi:hypothetical protein